MTTISWLALSWCLIPIAIVVGIYWQWQGKISEVLIASARTIIQLIAVGYVLVMLFETPSPWISLSVMFIMLMAASWIAIRPVKEHRIFQPVLISLLVSVIFHLAISLIFVLQLETWYQPNVLIPLAGMYFANTMNAISLSAERYFSELEHGKTPDEARIAAFHAAMIPQINSLLAVGLVALPGMMTGQILSGVSPLIAVRYQILIMTMLLGTCGLGSAILLWLVSKRAVKLQYNS